MVMTQCEVCGEPASSIGVKEADLCWDHLSALSGLVEEARVLLVAQNVEELKRRHQQPKRDTVEPKKG